MELSGFPMETIIILISALSLGIYLIITFFILLAYVPKLKLSLHQLIDLFCRAFIQIQFLTSIGYLSCDLSSDIRDIFQANQAWVYLNFADSLIDQDSDQETPDGFQATDQWSLDGFKNSITIITLIGVYILVYSSVRLAFMCQKKKSTFILHALQFQVCQQLLKLLQFRVSMNLMLQIRLLQQGKSFDQSSVAPIVLGTLILLVYPIVKISIIRLKYRSNNDEPNVYRVFGADYRIYRPCWRQFHLIVENLQILSWTIFLSLLSENESIQVYGLLGIEIGVFVYSVVVHPLKSRELNIQDWSYRAIRLSIIIAIFIFQFISSQDYLLLCLILIFYSQILFFSLINSYKSVKNLRSLLDKDSPDGFQPENRIIASRIKAPAKQQKKKPKKSQTKLEDVESPNITQDFTDRPTRNSDLMDPRLSKRRNRRKKGKLNV